MMTEVFETRRNPMPHRFHGRVQERTQVLGLLDAAEQGRGRALIVEGDEGTGKSALLAEAVDEARSRGFAVASAEAAGGREVVPLAPFFRALGEPATGPGASAGHQARADDSRAWLMEQLWLVEQLPLLLRAHSELGPLLVTVDDLQAADPATLLALRVLPPRLAPSQLVWLVTRRVGEGGPALDQLFDMLEGDGAERLVLGPVDDGTVADILSDGVGGPPGPALLTLAGEAGGNPELVVALAAGLSEEGRLAMVDGRAELISDGLPRRLHDVVARRRAGLSPDAGHLLEVASLVDGPFPVEDLCRVLGKPPSRLLSVLDEVLETGLLRSAGPELEFWCGLARRAVAETIPEPIRKAVRRQMGTAHPLQDHDLQDHDDRAAGGGAGFAEFPLAVPPARSDRELTVLSLASWCDGRLGEALERAREAVRRAEPSPVGTGPADVTDPALVLAAMLTDLGRSDEAARVLETVAADAAPTGDRRAAAALATVRARLALEAGDLDAAEAGAAWAEDPASEFAELVTAGSGAGASDTGASDTGAPQAHPMLPEALCVLAAAALRRGDLLRAAQHLERHRTALLDSPDLFGSARGTFLEAQLARAEHGAKQAMAVLATVYDGLPEYRTLLVEEPAAAGWMVRTAVDAGEHRRAKALVAAAAELADDNAAFPGVAAVAEHARGVLDQDPGALIHAARQHPHPWAQASASEDAGVVLAEAGDRCGALAQFDQAMAAYERAGAVIDAGRVRSRLRSLGVRRRHWRQAVRPVGGWESLTDTERSVADLVAQGLTNRQVAGRMFLSPHTIDFHLRQIFRKLDIGSRVELTRQVVERDSTETNEGRTVTSGKT
jgi:DNA-binding CsgD family transcriptional regulator/tetratricopeptide (TPR) repeat protein